MDSKTSDKSMTLWFVVGTAAELIKIYPVICKARERNLPWHIIVSGQSGKNFWKQYSDFGFTYADSVSLIDSETDLSSSYQALKFVVKMLFLSPKTVAQLTYTKFKKKISAKDLWIVHGDTPTSVTASVLGYRLGAQVFHVEAGMRSNSIFNPFPEEINRKLIARFAKYNMCPDSNAAENLKKERAHGRIVVTNGNTIIDAINCTLANIEPPLLPDVPFVIANFHRYENLSNKKRWQTQIDTILKVSRNIRVLLILQPIARAKIDSSPKIKKKLEESGVELVDRLPFSHFAHLLHNAEFVVTDGGSNQQECFYLGKPCLILRERTESLEGIGSTCVLSKFDPKVIDNFLENYKSFKNNPIIQKESPSDVILELILEVVKN